MKFPIFFAVLCRQTKSLNFFPALCFTEVTFHLNESGSLWHVLQNLFLKQQKRFVIKFHVAQLIFCLSF